VTTDRITAIEHCLRAHSIRASSPEPETIEAKLLFDADKLDATGAVGLVRLACIVGERSGRTGAQYAVIDDVSTLSIARTELPDIDLFHEWACERLDALYTDPGRRLGESRWDFMESFFTRFASEIDTSIDTQPDCTAVSLPRLNQETILITTVNQRGSDTPVCVG
jgi:uncharacterized protein